MQTEEAPRIRTFGPSVIGVVDAGGGQRCRPRVGGICRRPLSVVLEALCVGQRDPLPQRQVLQVEPAWPHQAHIMRSLRRTRERVVSFVRMDVTEAHQIEKGRVHKMPNHLLPSQSCQILI